MTKLALVILLGVLISLPACKQGDNASVRRYESINKSSVFIVDGEHSYLGRADYPADKNPTVSYGIKTVNFSDGHGNTCSNYGGITLSKSVAPRFVCDGTEFVKSEVDIPTYGRAFRYKSICWGFSNGACKYVKSGPTPARVIEYDVLPDGRLVNIYVAGYEARDQSNTLSLVSKDAL